MINRYLAPCRHCGGTVPADSGTVEKVGQSWQVAHISCGQAYLGQSLISSVGGLLGRSVTAQSGLSLRRLAKI